MIKYAVCGRIQLGISYFDAGVRDIKSRFTDRKGFCMGYDRHRIHHNIVKNITYFRVFIRIVNR